MSGSDVAADTSSDTSTGDVVEEIDTAVDVNDTTDDAADRPDEVATEIDADDAGSETDAAVSLGIGESCVEDLDCVTLRCVDLIAGEGGAICTAPCTTAESCPSGFGCLLVTGSGDAERLCLPNDLCVDPDGDGFGFGPDCLGPDCDEERDDVNPAADEACDGIDNDCDGRVDNSPVDANVDCTTPFPGACAEGRTQCTPAGIDCVGLRGPTAEVCDGIDNDCDGAVDDEIASLTFYRDVDGDGFAAPGAESREACARPIGFVENTRDCDDTDDTRYPGAEEIPGDAADSNCDGLEICYADRDRDSYRTDEFAPSEDTTCDAPGLALATLPSGDCNDDDAVINPGRAETIGDGVDVNCDGVERCYADGDDDGARGFGTFPSTDVTCSGPGEALATAPIDCDDLDALERPGLPEVCGDERDNDCDGRFDEGARCYVDGEDCVVDIDCISRNCVDDVCAPDPG